MPLSHLFEIIFLLQPSELSFRPDKLLVFWSPTAFIMQYFFSEQLQTLPRLLIPYGHFLLVGLEVESIICINICYNTVALFVIPFVI